MFEQYYSLNSPEELKAYLLPYLQMVKHVCHSFDIDLDSSAFSGDHLGVQVLDSDEFDKVSEILSTYSAQTKDNVIHERRNRLFKFNVPINADGIEIPYIETFEPKPDADIYRLKAGVEHVSFKVLNYDSFLKEVETKNVPVGKTIEIGKSKVIKTKFLNLVEVEFRNDSLSEIV